MPKINAQGIVTNAALDEVPATVEPVEPEPARKEESSPGNSSAASISKTANTSAPNSAQRKHARTTGSH